MAFSCWIGDTLFYLSGVVYWMHHCGSCLLPFHRRPNNDTPSSSCSQISNMKKCSTQVDSLLELSYTLMCVIVSNILEYWNATAFLHDFMFQFKNKQDKLFKLYFCLTPVSHDCLVYLICKMSGEGIYLQPKMKL